MIFDTSLLRVLKQLIVIDPVLCLSPLLFREVIRYMIALSI